MQGYFAIDDIDIRDSFCGTTPTNAGMTVLTTPATVTRPTTAAQSLLIEFNLESTEFFSV